MSTIFTLEQLKIAAETSGVEQSFVEKLIAALRVAQFQPNALTIVCNEGLHPIPKDQLPGRVFAATTGNVADETPEVLEQTVADACGRVAQLIKTEGGFAEIYIVPSGYSVLLQKIAETVFQITGKPPITLHFDHKTNSYWPIQIDLRTIIAKA